MIALGFFFLVFGGKHHEKTMYLFGIMSFVTVFMVVLFALILPKNAPEHSVWLGLALATVLGHSVGRFVREYARTGVLLIGAWMGALFGSLFYTLVVSRFEQENPLLTLWVTIILCSIAVAILSQIYFDHTVIVGSAIVGSYIFIRVSVRTIDLSLG
jgi:hypothetical protein